MPFSDRTRFKQISLAVLTALGTLTQTAPARADDAAPANKLETVQVTGSNIRRTDTETPSPVQVITADDLKKSGYTSVAQVLSNLTANNQGTLSQSFNGAFATGASGIALRGLTVGATLVLIDGHRSTAYPIGDDGERAFVDTSSIPFDAIERIEILKDGASAIYGSDAIAGVVNVILKKHFEGTRVNAEAGLSMYGDGGTQHLSITSGRSLGEGTDGFVSLEYRHQSPITYANRMGRLTNRDFRNAGGIDATPGVANSNNGNYPGSLTGYTIGADGSATLLPGCSPSSPNYNYTGFCSFNANYLQLQPDTHNLNFVGKLNTSLANNWELGVTGTVFSSWAEQVDTYTNTAYQFGGLANPALVPGQLPTAYPASGPYLVTVPSTGDPLVYNFASLGPRHTVVDSQTYRLTADLSGEAMGWNLDAALGYTKALLHSRATGYISIPGLQGLINANASASPAQIAALLGDPANSSTLGPIGLSTSSSELDYLSLRADREVAKLPGGPLAMSVGVDYTHRVLDTESPGAAQFGYQAMNDTYAFGSQDIASAYLELDGQVLKQLEINAAARVDSVNTYGTSTTPKVGFKFTPIPEATLRGTYAKGFRAPNPAESGNSGQAFFLGTVADPALCPGGAASTTGAPQVGDFLSQCSVPLTYVQTSTRNLQPETSNSYTLGLLLEPVAGYNASVDYYSIKLKNQITAAGSLASFDPFANAVRGPGGELLAPVTGTNPLTTGAPTAANPGVILYTVSPYVNANSTETDGVDIDLRARWKLQDIGTLSANLQVNHMFHYKLTSGGNTVELAGTHGPSGTSGDTGTPQTRAQLTVDLERQNWGIATTVDYISHFSVTDPAIGQNSCGDALVAAATSVYASSANIPANYCYVASFTTFDLSGHYALSKQLTLHGSITNLFNREPPLDLETYGQQNYNPSLHQAGAVGRFFTVGATYDF